MLGVSPVACTMVDSTPTWQGPPSSRKSTSSPSSARTWSAVVGLTEPKRFADAAATAPPKADSRASATGWSGTRTATVTKPQSPPAGPDGRAAASVSAVRPEPFSQHTPHGRHLPHPVADLVHAAEVDEGVGAG